jgi:hypothetical protein
MEPRAVARPPLYSAPLGKNPWPSLERSERSLGQGRESALFIKREIQETYVGSYHQAFELVELLIKGTTLIQHAPESIVGIFLSFRSFDHNIMSNPPTSNPPSQYPTDFREFTAEHRRQFVQFIDDDMEMDRYKAPVPEHLKACNTNRYCRESEVRVFTSD